ncbi:MAG: sensor histidine kinase, partial [Schumannella sp.]|nr:sensor histidine kinase [Schumannella sp.]
MRTGWSLQRRLVVALVMLLAVVSVIVGASSALALRQNLLQRLDGVVAGDLRVVEGIISGQPNAPGNGDPLGARASVRLVMNDDGSSALGQYVDAERERHDLNAAQAQQLIAGATSSRPASVTLDGIGEFRAARGEVGGIVYIVGISTDEVTTTTNNLIRIFALVTLAALAVAAVAGTIVVR